MPHHSPHAYNSAGRIVRLGPQLGRGGEGTVYEVLESPSFVAKVYHRPVGVEKAAKLDLMVRKKTERLLGISAWPVDTLRDSPAGATVGLLMPRVSEYRPIHVLYGPKSRRDEFPQAGYRFLVNAAANVARAFSVLHDHNIVIGDVNQGNLVVSEQGTVKLIDCDSFQLITSHDRFFLCPVGVPTHTPPELQGRHLSSVQRTENHDAFGLAVVIFQLLFLGKHPFSGRFLGPEEMPLEKAIAQCRFAYAADATARLMKPPPGAPGLVSASREIAAMFERAFALAATPQRGRPVAAEWTSALQSLFGALRKCPANQSHEYWKELRSCPWCEIEKFTGTTMFSFVSASPLGVSGSFDIAAVWAQISAVASPGPLRALPNSQARQVLPTKAVAQRAKEIRSMAWPAQLAVVFTIVGGVAMCVAIPAAFIVWIIVALGLSAYILDNTPGRTERDTARKEHQAAVKTAKDLVRQVTLRYTATSDEEFNKRRQFLEAQKKDYEQLGPLRQHRIQQLQANRQTSQLQRFLDRYRIADHRIRGIGPAKSATLTSYGIETAADIARVRILAIPGFGPVLDDELERWRRNIERGFRFDPNRPIDPQDIAEIERDISQRRSNLEQSLRNGRTGLETITAIALSRRPALHDDVLNASKRLAQAEADLSLFL